jgi:hypothetical protein
MSATAATPEQRLTAVRERVRAAAEAAGREPAAVTLIAVSKTFSAAAMRRLAEAGQRAFGESYAQEAADKQDALADLDLEWHFVGPLQSNKARLVAPRFHWVHSVDRIKIARALERHAAEAGHAVDTCLQVNVSGEAAKSGCTPEAVTGLAETVAAECPHLRLRGLMAIPAASGDPRPAFERLAALLTDLRERGVAGDWDSLSMGMSNDFEQAIACGATHVRVGSALFGERDYGPTQE